MREAARTIAKAVLWLVGGGLQGVAWLWTTLVGISVTAAFGVVVNYLRDMPDPHFWLLIAVVFILVFVVFNHLTAWGIRRHQRQALSPGTTIIERIEHAYFNQSPGTQIDERKEDAKLENSGRVSIKQWAPQEINWHGREVVCVVPYKSYDTESAFFEAPALKFSVENRDEVFLIVVDYEVRGENAVRPEPDEDLERELQELSGRPPIQLPIRIEVVVLTVGEDARVVRELHIHSGEVEELEGGSWRHVVHDNGTVSGLPVGEYGINVCDYLDAPFDLTSNERREYRNMHLRVIRQQ